MQKSEIELTIIIPAYNVEKYIENALESIFKGVQKYKYEVIVIDDNSVDNTVKIVEKIKNKNKNLKIIKNITNLGVSYSRNIGIKNASGKYIAFLDADDTIEPLMYDMMIEEAEKSNVQVVITNYYEIIHNKKYNSKYTYNFLNESDLIKDYLTDKISMAVWDKIYDLSWINEKKITFDESIKIGEDVLFFLEILYKNPKISFLKKSLYNYYQRENSVMHEIKDSMIELAKLSEKIPKDLCEYLDKKYAHEFMLFKCIEMIKALHAISRCKKNTYKEKYVAIKRILNESYFKFIFKSDISLYIKLEILIIKYMGIYTHLFLFPLYDFIKVAKRSNG